jgi:STE24 endopeptidase
MKIYLSVMQVGYVNVHKKKAPVLMPRGRYLVAGNYAVARERLGIAESFVEYLLFLWWVYRGFAWLQGLTGIDGTVGGSVFFLMGFFAVNWLVTLPFEIYGKFGIDQSFGFNKMTPRMYAADTLKQIVLFVSIGGAISAVLSWIIVEIRHWWFWGFLLIFAVVLGANLLMPFFMGLFYKFTPLEDGELRTAIETLMERAGLRSQGVFVMNAGEKSTKLNAFFGGLGKSKRVVLFDTLIAKLSGDELLAVLGHELGHFRHGDIWKNIAMTGGFLLLAFYLLGHLPAGIFSEMGVVPTPGAQIALIVLLLPVLSFVYTPLMSLLSRHNEYEADRYGSEVGGREHLVSALLKLVSENKSFPKSDPIYSRFYHTHPPILERLEALGFDPERVDMDEELPREGIFGFLDRDDGKKPGE